MKRYIHSLIFIIAACVAANAVEVVGTPGALSTKVSDLKTTELRVSGEIDARDLFFIGDQMTELRTLDLSQCKIVTYSGKPIKGNSYYVPAAIPPACFAGSKIERITMPSNYAITIGDGAFADSQLRSLILDTSFSIKEGAFAACNKLTTVTLRGKGTVGAYAFRGCQNLTTADLTGVTRLYDKAFASCPSLTDVNFGANLTRIDNAVFEDCNLSSARLANTKLTIIGAWAFADNSALKYVALPASVYTFGNGVFADCPLLTEFVLPANCKTIPDYAFKDNGLKSISLGEVEHIGAFALKGNTELHTIELPSMLEYIGDNAMEGMTGLANINGRGLTAVPQLGEDVWEGIDQSRVLLIVKSAKVPDFRDTPQWQDFRIIDEQTGKPETEIANNDLRGYIANSILKLKSSGSEIATVEVYDIAGLQVANCYPDTAECDIDLSQSSARLYIVRVALADGSVYNLKLAR